MYQRLLAMDQLEAQTIVGQFLKTKSLVELYDEVLIPALSMAEQDRHKGGIDGPREEFLFLSMNEMIAEFSEYQPPEGASGERPPLPSGARIFCLPAHDRADEITASMLAQLLEQMGFVAVAFPAGGTPPNEWLALLAAGANDVLCISALPPYAFAPAKALCKQVRERFPHLRIVVSVWGFGGDAEKGDCPFRPGAAGVSMHQPGGNVSAG